MTRSEVVGIAFVILVLWEAFRPAAAHSAPLVRRWFAGAALYVTGRAATTLIARGLPVAAAVVASPAGVMAKVPLVAQVVLTILVLDLVGYFRHRWFHANPWLWRIHAPHHSDVECDLSTAFRFHPVETILTSLSDFAVVLLLGPPAVAVVIHEGLAGVIDLTGHANVSLPRWFERAMALGFITPGLHRTHHSSDAASQMSNYGIIFPWWDRLFGTLRREPAPSQFGIEEQRGPNTWSFLRLLIAPIGSGKSGGAA